MAEEKTLLESIGGIEYRNLDGLDANSEIILVTNTHTILRDLPSQLLKRTKLIVHPNSGYDNFIQDQNLWQNIPFVIGHTIRAQAVAEYTLGCVFEGRLELPQHLSWSETRNWNRRLLKGEPILIFGYGHIGKIVADTLATIGMMVTVVDPFITSCPHTLIKEWSQVEMRNFKAVLMCCGLNKFSHHILNQDFFASLRDDVLIVNGARGPLIDELALREYLLTHPQSFAFLDVFEKEPFTEQWHNFPQVWKTSHIAGVHKDLDRGILGFEYQTISDFMVEGFMEKYHNALLQNKIISGAVI